MGICVYYFKNHSNISGTHANSIMLTSTLHCSIPSLVIFKIMGFHLFAYIGRRNGLLLIVLYKYFLIAKSNFYKH